MNIPHKHSRPVRRAILAILALFMTGCNPLNLKWSIHPAGGDTVVDRLIVECIESGGEWTKTGCDPPFPWRKTRNGVPKPGEQLRLTSAHGLFNR